MIFDKISIGSFLGLDFHLFTYSTNKVIWQAVDITFESRGYGQTEGIGLLSFDPIGIVLKTRIYYKDLDYLGVRDKEYDSSIFRLRNWWHYDWH
jgi:hypothetical protein